MGNGLQPERLRVQSLSESTFSSLVTPDVASHVFEAIKRHQAHKAENAFNQMRGAVGLKADAVDPSQPHVLNLIIQPGSCMFLELKLSKVHQLQLRALFKLFKKKNAAATSMAQAMQADPLALKGQDHHNGVPCHRHPVISIYLRVLQGKLESAYMAPDTTFPSLKRHEWSWDKDVRERLSHGRPQAATMHRSTGHRIPWPHASKTEVDTLLGEGGCMFDMNATATDFFAVQDYYLTLEAGRAVTDQKSITKQSEQANQAKPLHIEVRAMATIRDVALVHHHAKKLKVGAQLTVEQQKQAEAKKKEKLAAASIVAKDDHVERQQVAGTTVTAQVQPQQQHTGVSRTTLGDPFASMTAAESGVTVSASRRYDDPFSETLAQAPSQPPPQPQPSRPDPFAAVATAVDNRPDPFASTMINASAQPDPFATPVSASATIDPLASLPDTLAQRSSDLLDSLPDRQRSQRGDPFVGMDSSREASRNRPSTNAYNPLDSLPATPAPTTATTTFSRPPLHPSAATRPLLHTTLQDLPPSDAEKRHKRRIILERVLNEYSVQPPHPKPLSPDTLDAVARSNSLLQPMPTTSESRSLSRASTPRVLPSKPDPTILDAVTVPAIQLTSVRRSNIQPIRTAEGWERAPEPHPLPKKQDVLTSLSTPPMRPVTSHPELAASLSKASTPRIQPVQPQPKVLDALTPSPSSTVTIKPDPHVLDRVAAPPQPPPRRMDVLDSIPSARDSVVAAASATAPTASSAVAVPSLRSSSSTWNGEDSLDDTLNATTLSDAAPLNVNSPSARFDVLEGSLFDDSADNTHMRTKVDLHVLDSL